jgi:hypothetical protein
MPKGAKSRNALETELQLGEIPRRVIFGKTATAGSLVDAVDYGGKYGTDHEVVIFALADHECDSLVEFYVNDLLITYTGDGAYTQIDPTADSPHLWVYFRSGTEFRPAERRQHQSPGLDLLRQWSGHLLRRRRLPRRQARQQEARLSRRPPVLPVGRQGQEVLRPAARRHGYRRIGDAPLGRSFDMGMVGEPDRLRL